MCCSNWSTSQPSSVQWPVLCTRGANSLTSRRRRRARTARRRSRPHSRGRRAGWRRSARPRRAASGRGRRPARWCGAGRRSRGGSRPADRAAISPSRPRAAMIDSSRRKSAGRLGDGRALRRCAAKAASASSGALDPGLALAVVAPAPGLQQQRARPAAPARPSRSVRARRRRRRRRWRRRRALRKVFSSSRSWAMAERAAAGRDRARPAPARRLERRGGHVLELEGDRRRDASASACERLGIVVGARRWSARATRAAGASGLGRRARRRRSPGARRPGPACGRAGRRPGCRWSSRAGAGSGRQRSRVLARSRGTAAVWARAEGGDARAARAGSDRARIWAASRPALRAPGLADRQRPHRHAGRHLHDGEQGIQAVQRLGLHGTPSTGSSVSAAVMPGRCAAPPAPAMITLKPAALRSLGEGVQPLGRAVGGDHLGLRRPRPARPALGRAPSSSASRSGCP